MHLNKPPRSTPVKPVFTIGPSTAEPWCCSQWDSMNNKLALQTIYETHDKNRVPCTSGHHLWTCWLCRLRRPTATVWRKNKKNCARMKQTSLATVVMNLSSWEMIITPPFHVLRASMSASNPFHRWSVKRSTKYSQNSRTSISKWFVG